MIIEDDIIVEDPLDIKHLLTKYYIEELIDAITKYHSEQMRFSIYNKLN